MKASGKASKPASLARALFDAIERWSSTIGVTLFFIIMLSVTTDVIFRTITGQSISSVYELNELLMVGGFLILSYTQKQRGHVTVELILTRLKGKAYYFTELSAMLLTAVICVIFLWQGIVQLQLAIDMNFITDGLIPYPLWPSKLCVCIGFFLLCFRLTIQIYDKLRGRKEQAVVQTELII
jgi:TRAP-type C4-dicarboxylate transport system permease small subunit